MVSGVEDQYRSISSQSGFLLCYLWSSCCCCGGVSPRAFGQAEGLYVIPSLLRFFRSDVFDQRLLLARARSLINRAIGEGTIV